MQRMKRCARDGGGFTLVELMVVVGIIAILVAILLPSFSRVIKQAKTVMCLSNIRGIGRAMHSYATANNRYVIRDVDWQGGLRRSWVIRYAKYLASDIPLSYDPVDSTGEDRLDPLLRSIQAYKCPTVSPSDAHSVHYVTNGLDLDAYKNNGTWTGSDPTRLDWMPKLSELAAFMDFGLNGMEPQRTDRNDIIRAEELTFLGNTANTAPRSIDAREDRHWGEAQVMFYDGNARPCKVNPVSLSTRMWNPYYPP